MAVDDGAALAAILGMAVVTYATRAGGLWLMSHVPPDAEVVASFLRHLSGSVLVALVVSGAVQGNMGVRCGVAVSLIVMARTRRGLVAMACGVATAAVVRAIASQ